jgi:hypothetical protein
MNASYLSDQFATAVPYDRYVATGTDEQRRRWQSFYDVVRLTDAQRQLVAGFGRDNCGTNDHGLAAIGLRAAGTSRGGVVRSRP